MTHYNLIRSNNIDLSENLFNSFTIAQKFTNMKNKNILILNIGKILDFDNK